jgi:hypothetical protein
MKFSEAGNSAMRDIRSARLAIFNGQPTAAIKLMEGAKTSIGQAEKEAPTFVTTSTMMINGKAVEKMSGKEEVNKVPFDGQLVLGDNFVMTPEKKTHIDKANEHLQKGEHTKAVEELRLGDIDVNFARELMPVAKADKGVDEAIKLATDGKYYEANLALKAIEDGVTIDSVNIFGLAPPPPQ